MKYLANTFSPAMLAIGMGASIKEVRLQDVPADIISAVSHEVTAAILTALLGRKIEFARINITLSAEDYRCGDEVFAIIPSFRASEARECAETGARSGRRATPARSASPRVGDADATTRE